MDEDLLIRSSIQGNLEAFNHLVLAYQDVVYQQAYHLLGERQAASDAAQEAFISAYQHIKGYKGGSFRAWLLRIVTNACYDELRRRLSHPVTHLVGRDDGGKEIEPLERIASPAASPEELVIKSELDKTIEDSLATLLPQYRAAIILVDLLGMDYIEAAEAAGAPLGTLKSRLARARRQMRAILRQNLDFPTHLPEPI